MNFVDCTTEEGKKALAKFIEGKDEVTPELRELYEKLTGKKWEKPTKLESLSEIKEIMEENRGVWRE